MPPATAAAFATTGLVALALAACGSSGSSGPSSAPRARTYDLSVLGASEPVRVQVQLPATWKETPGDRGEPWFALPGVDGALLTIAAVSPAGTADERMAKAIKLQYGDAAGATRADLPGGRVWIVEHEGSREHARMFVPYADGVVMGAAMLEDPDGTRVPAIRAVFDTITIVAPAAR